MHRLEKLVTGYKKFLNHDAKDFQRQYRHLADAGQSPKIMMIGCSDSRVNPDLIFNTSPGDLFVVRNVANLVPPFEGDGAYHGTSAAIEFAVEFLKVEHIVIMGHSLCGGVKACCDTLHGHKVEGLFIPKWTSILHACAKKVLEKNPEASEEQIRNYVEKEAIKASLENLKAFPFIQKNINAAKLQVHGVYFDIKDVQLYALDNVTQEFLPIE